MKEAWEKDAEDFGRRLRFGDWNSALRVARSVEALPIGGAGKALSRSARSSGKATASQFAAAAGSHKTTVARYLKTWTRPRRTGSFRRLAT